VTNKSKYISLIILFLILSFIGYQQRARLFPVFANHYLYDEVGVISKADIPRFDAMLEDIFRESDIGIKIIFVSFVQPLTVEEAAVKKMNDLRIGGKGKEERGVLFLYVMDEKKLRAEVGYGLEEYFPDAFIGYLVRDYGNMFFSKPTSGSDVRFLIRILQHRIRSAILKNAYDPRLIDDPPSFTNLSGGAGATETATLISTDGNYKRDALSQQERGYFSPQTTVEGTYRKYLEWLYARKFDPDVPIFTRQTSSMMKSFPMTSVYFDFILLQEAGRSFKVLERGELAMMYCTNDPLVTPHLFRKIDGLWLLDIASEARDAKEFVGGPYTWSFVEGEDEYTRVFRDKMIDVQNYYRVEGGDNRPLPVRQSP